VGKLIYVFMAAAAGLAMAVQGSLNALLGKVIGFLESTLVVHVLGTLILCFLLFVLHLGEGNWSQWQQAPWYAYLGGGLNVLIIFGVLFSISRLGVTNATNVIIVFQILTAVLIDHCGWFGVEKKPFRWWDILGIVLLGSAARILLK